MIKGVENGKAHQSSAIAQHVSVKFFILAFGFAKKSDARQTVRMRWLQMFSWFMFS
jgi:hypothetical protein